MRHLPSQPKEMLPKQEGVVLLEALIAILIFSFGILGLVGLQAAMIKNTTDNRYRTEAGYIAQQTLGAMWSTPGNLANHVETDAPISTLPNGKRTVSLPATAAGTGGNQVQVTITWQQPGQPDTHSLTVNARISGG